MFKLVLENLSPNPYLKVTFSDTFSLILYIISYVGIAGFLKDIISRTGPNFKSGLWVLTSTVNLYFAFRHLL